MKKTFIFFISIMMVFGILAGCSKGTSGASEKKKVETIRIVAANHPWTEAIKKQLPEFEKKTGIKVKLDSYFEDQLTQKTSVEFASNSKNIDVVMFSPLQNGRMFYGNGYFTDLEKYAAKEQGFTDDFYSSSLIKSEKDKLYGIPLVIETQVLYYRKDILEAAGLKPPTTMEELKEQAEKLSDPNKDLYGFVSRGKRASAVSQFSSFLYSFGGDYMKDGKSAINSPEALKAFEYYGGLLKDYGPPGTLNMSWPEAMGVFTQGKAVFFPEASSLYTNATDKTKSSISDKVGFAPFPAGPAGSKPYSVTAWGIGIGANSEKKDAAWDFIKWATSKEVVAKLQTEGITGARKSVWDSPEVNKAYPEDLVEAMKVNNEKGIPTTIPLITHVGEARDVIGDVIITAINGEDVKKAAKKADEEFNKIIEME
ncbi:ABC transporter substrate-binding protein [Bacillus salipaludis]|uniref:ABC transporter substrate-binding protein n=1 Tax=Bacillus salipaludis TaxID=2547811 RepID=A0ABW8RKL7_9BACI